MTERGAGASRELLNYPSISYTTLRGWPLVGVGGAMLSLGALCVLRWQGVVSVGRVHAPLWVMGVVGAVFVLAGMLLVIYALLDLRGEARRRRVRLTHPGEPWRADFDWSKAMTARGMPSRDSGRWWTHVLGLAILLAMATVSNWLAVEMWGKGIEGWFLLLMAGLMDLIVLLVIGLVVRWLVMRVRYGSPRIVLERVPVRPGGALRARVAARGLGGAERIVVTLREVAEVYEQRRTSSRGRPKRVVVCRELEAHEVVIEDVGAGVAEDGALAVEFAVPASAASCALSERPARFWDLEVHARGRGVDFVHRFTVPVYADPGAG